MPRLELAAARLLLIAGIAAALPAAAEPPPGRDAASRLHDVESAIKESTQHRAEAEREVEQISREIAALREQMVETARAVQDYEEGLSAIDMKLLDLNSQAGVITESLARRRGEYAAMLAALVRFSQNPPEAALLLPAPPIDTVRGAMVLRAALPPLESGIRSLSDQLASLTELKAKIAREKKEKLAAATNLKQESTHLDDLMRRMVTASKRAQSESSETARRLAKLSADARDLKDLLARIEAARPKAAAKKKAPEMAALAPPPVPGAQPFSAARGSLTLPARGRMVKTFGQPTQAGLSSKGLTIATRGNARVVAPYDGRVVFAGPFRGYGQLLIIAQGEGYHILLAGLSRIDCVVGQWLLAGEPVGVMGPAENGDPQLYVELRHDGEPINPLPWMAARNEKVNG